MTANSARQTFLSFGELFSRSAERCMEAESCLRTLLPECREPYTELIKLVANAEHRLANDLLRVARDAPARIVSTQVQFTPEAQEPQHPLTLEGALANVTAVNDQLAHLLSDLRQKTAMDRVRTAPIRMPVIIARNVSSGFSCDATAGATCMVRDYLRTRAQMHILSISGLV